MATRESREAEFIPVESLHCCPRVSALNHIPLLCNKANFQILSSSSICHLIKIVLK